MRIFITKGAIFQLSIIYLISLAYKQAVPPTFKRPGEPLLEARAN